MASQEQMVALGEMFVEGMEKEAQRNLAVLEDKLRREFGVFPAPVSASEKRSAALTRFMLREMAAQQALVARLFRRTLTMMYAEFEEAQASGGETEKESGSPTQDERGTSGEDLQSRPGG